MAKMLVIGVFGYGYERHFTKSCLYWAKKEAEAVVYYYNVKHTEWESGDQTKPEPPRPYITLNPDGDGQSLSLHFLEWLCPGRST